MDAVARAACAESAIFALIVDAKDDAAASFYQQLKCQRLASKPMSLFLPITMALAALHVKPMAGRRCSQESVEKRPVCRSTRLGLTAVVAVGMGRDRGTAHLESIFQ